MISVSLKQLCLITNGVLHNKSFNKEYDLICNSISTNSKNIHPQCLFIALIGKNFDAHNFIHEAIEKGAIAILLEKRLNISTPQIVVKNTTIALGKIALWVRTQSNAKIIALTGSSGKTSVKEIATTIFKTCGKTLSTFQNLNNNIGVSLTLLNLNLLHKYAIIEIGANNFKEILYATKLTRPNIVLINNIYHSHLDGFGSLLGVSKAKQEIFFGLPKTGTAILNADSHCWKQWKKKIKDRNIIWFSINKKSQLFASNISLSDTGSSFLLHSPYGKINVNIPLLGLHNVSNALAATAIAVALKIPLKFIQLGLSKIPKICGRLEVIKLNKHKIVINDTYNSNVGSMTAAIKVLENMPGHTIFIAGDMSELGKMNILYHQIIGKTMHASKINEVMSIGKLSKEISINSKKGKHYTSLNELMNNLFKKIYLHKKIAILIKGSRSEKLEIIVNKLVQEYNHDHTFY
ncbi:MAG: UDP-N-acetylmuramoyl-tripeptide--D-alanyl-D-alanine ligase [Buchnera aphidicola (Floraphis choui)]